MDEDVVQPEFSRPLAVEDVGEEGVEREIAANARELQALATRMKLPAIRSLRARLRIVPEKRGALMVRGHMEAQVEQECVRTLEAFPATVEAEIARLFVPADSPQARALEAAPVVELDADAPDAPDIIHGGEIDLGELVAEHLALSLDPWPKKPGTDFIDMQVGGDDEQPAEGGEGGTDGKEHPFAALKALKERE